MRYPAVQRWLEERALVEPALLDGAGLEMLLAERVSAFGGEAAYVAALDGSPDEVDRLIAAIAVPETWLFRYPRSFDLLLDVLRRRLEGGAARLRMLSAGCATGQEAHCMAIAALCAGWPADRVEVEGLDRNRGFLEIAAAGKYGASSVRSEIPAWALPYLHHGNGAVEIDAAARSMVKFRRADITVRGGLKGGLGGEGPRDVIFCRNVMIYLNAAARAQLLESICEELAPGGVVFVGHAEQLVRGATPLKSLAVPHAFAMEKGDAAAAPAPPKPTRRTRPAAPIAVPPNASPAAAPRPAAPAAAPEDTLQAARDLADAGRAADSEGMIRRLIARRGPDAPAMELLAMIRMSVDDVAGAKRLFERAVYLEPDRSTSLLQLALISERSGEARRAAAYWDRARRVSAAAQGESGA